MTGATTQHFADGLPELPEGLREQWRSVNGIRLHCVEAGDPTGPKVVLLHGFPEFWRAWAWQMPPLARAGYHVIAPDMRGYNLSDKPPHLADYRLDRLVADLVALIDSLGGTAHVAAHDWGGIVAWHHAQRHPQQVRKLVIVNAPHPGRMKAVMKKPAQWLKSWYVAFFQLPLLPELLMRFAGTRMLHGRRPFSQADKAAYRRAWARPGALSAMINYYRAMRLGRGDLTRAAHWPMPVLVIWGLQDQALLPDHADGLQPWVPDLRVVKLPQASHWVMHDEPLRLSNLLLDFLD